MRPLFIALAPIALLLAGTPASAGQTKVTMCHYPPTNLDNPQTITVGEAAAEAHIASHGDTLGTCEDSPGPNPVCGDGIWDEGEECDGDPFPCGPDFNTCTAECLCDFVPEPGAECGNGVWEEGEECDGDPTPCGGSPEWICTEECLCEEDYPQPDPYCGDGNVDPGEQCDTDAYACIVAGIGNHCGVGCTCDFAGSCYPADCSGSTDPACCEVSTSTCSEEGICTPIPGAISGTVWSDANGDGVVDAGEPGVAGITVLLFDDADNDGLPDGTGAASTVTAIDGSYAFSDLLGRFVLQAQPATCTTFGPDSYVDPTTGFTYTVLVLPSNPPMLVAGIDIGLLCPF